MWKANGYDVVTLKVVLTEAKDRKVKIEEGEDYQLLRVGYSGEISDGETLDCESSYSYLLKVKAWDILISNMGVGRGATGIVPSYHNDKYVSNEYTILRANSKEEALFYSTLLRSDEILADILSYTTGMNRGRVKWKTISQIAVPRCDTKDSSLTNGVAAIETLWAQVIAAQTLRESQREQLANRFQVCDEDAKERWLSYKPPE